MGNERTSEDLFAWLAGWLDGLDETETEKRQKAEAYGLARFSLLSSVCLSVYLLCLSLFALTVACRYVLSVSFLSVGCLLANT